MKLCYIAPAENIHTYRWLQAFVARGHEVHLVTLPNETGNIPGVHLHPLPAGQPKLRFPIWTLTLRRILHQLQPDILHAHYLTRYGWLAAATGFHPLVLTAWGTDAYIDPQRSRLTRLLTPWMLQRADLVTVDATDLQTQVLTLKARPERVVLVQWGVDTQVFTPQQNTAGLRTRLRLEQRPIILSTRNLMPNYNQDIIIEALARVRQQLPTAVLLIKYNTCNPDYLAQLQEQIHRARLEEAVQFISAVPHHELAAYYAMADVFVSIATSDSTPVSLLEAMACGVPPVMSDLSAIQEWITPGKNGECVPARDPVALSTAILSILRHPERRAAMAAINRELVQTRASHTVEMDRVARLYNNLVHPAGGKS